MEGSGPTGRELTAKKATVRFAPALWALVQAAAARRGVSASEYIRKAARAHAIADAEAGLAGPMDPGSRDQAAAVRAQSRQARHQASALRQRALELYTRRVTTGRGMAFRMSPDGRHLHDLHTAHVFGEPHAPNGNWVESLVHPDDRPGVTAAIEQAIDTRSVFALEHRVRGDDGTFRWVYCRAVPLLNDAGEIVEWLGAVSYVAKPA